MDLPKEHYRALQAMGRLREDEPLPEQLTDRYWEVKRCLDRVGAGVMPTDLAWLALEYGYGKTEQVQDPQPTVADLWRKKEIKVGQRVIVKWRGSDHGGTLQGVTSGNELIVVLDGQPEKRRFGVDRVSIAA